MMIKIMIGHNDVGDDDVGEAIKDADLDLEANLHSPLRGLQGTFCFQEKIEVATQVVWTKKVNFDVSCPMKFQHFPFEY